MADLAAVAELGDARLRLLALFGQGGLAPRLVVSGLRFLDREVQQFAGDGGLHGGRASVLPRLLESAQEGEHALPYGLGLGILQRLDFEKIHPGLDHLRFHIFEMVPDRLRVELRHDLAFLHQGAGDGEIQQNLAAPRIGALHPGGDHAGVTPGRDRAGQPDGMDQRAAPCLHRSNSRHCGRGPRLWPQKPSRRSHGCQNHQEEDQPPVPARRVGRVSGPRLGALRRPLFHNRRVGGRGHAGSELRRTHILTAFTRIGVSIAAVSGTLSPPGAA